MIRKVIVGGGFLLLWEGLVHVTGTPIFILPPPSSVLPHFVDSLDLLALHAAATCLEIGLGMLLGCGLGVLSGISLMALPALRAWALPLFVATQAIPVFAIAPLLVVWLGYGLMSKVTMAALVIFFPVASALFDGLRRTEADWLEMADVMNATPWATLLQIRLPAALPSLASGLRVAAGVAPIGAVIGEWVGSSAGLGYLMMQQLARGQTSLAFAALLILCLLAVALYFAVDAGLRRALRWTDPNPSAVPNG